MTEEEKFMVAEILDQLYHTLADISRSMVQVEERLKRIEATMVDGK